jgi:tRNA threonylcarbamoyladenosine biosynthesis protein TsaE
MRQGQTGSNHPTGEQDLPILKADELDILSSGAEQTRRYGKRLGGLLRAGDVLCLSGELGAGKTVLASGIGAGWGAIYRVTSPTFNLVHEHRREKDKQRLYHLDCYRLENERDAESIAIDDIFESGDVVMVEWPERIEQFLPAQRLWIEMTVIDDTRRNLILQGTGQRYEELIRQFREAAFGV